MVLTHPRPVCGRPLDEVVTACVRAGATAIQLRDKTATGGTLLAIAHRLRAITAATAVPLIVNDRLDIALAAGADGVHLGPDDLPVSAARALAPPPFLIGYSTDDPREARRAAREGADYLGVGAVFGTHSKPGLADHAIGPDRVRAVLRASGLPCLGIGGITPANAPRVLATGAGVAVLSAVMSSPDPTAAVHQLAAGCKNTPHPRVADTRRSRA